MASFHARSNSFPSQSHPVTKSVEDQLCRLKSSEAASTSASSICVNIDGLRVLHEGINDQIKMSSIQQALSHEQGQKLTNELLEGSLRLVDLCGFSRDIVQLTKESLQDLESSIRRNKGEAVDINSYVASRNKIKKMINKYAKNLKDFNKISAEVISSDCVLKEIGTRLKDAEVLASSTLQSLLTLLSGAKDRSNQRSWSLLLNFMKTSRIHSKVEQEICVEDLCSLDIAKSQKGLDSMALQNMLKQLKASEMIVQEIEEGLESLYRSLVITRVSLLNVLSH